MNIKTTKIIGWVLTGLVAFALIASAAFKLAGAGEAAEKSAAAFGLTVLELKIIGIIELFCIIMFIIPRTGVLGILLVAAYLGGAIVTHIEHAQAPFAPIIVEILAWTAAVLRFPELLKRIKGVKEIV